MTESYGPGASGVPEWEAPTGATAAQQPRWSNPAGPGPALSAPGAQAPSAIPTYRSWQPGFMPLRPLQLGDYLSLPMKAMTYNRTVIIGGPLLCLVAALLAAAIAASLVVVDEWDLIQGHGHWSSLGGGTILSIIVAIVLLLATDVTARALVVPGVSRAILGQRITLAQTWKALSGRLGQVFLLYLLVTLASVAGIVLFALIAGGVGSTGSFGATIVVILLGYLVLIVAAVCVAFLVGIALPALMLERLNAVASMRRAFTLLRGNFWRTFGSFLLIGFILSLINNAVSGVLQVVFLALGSLSVNVTVIIVVIVLVVVLSLVVQSVFSYSYLGALFTLMYVDLRIRTEGFDIDLARAAEAAARR